MEKLKLFYIFLLFFLSFRVMTQKRVTQSCISVQTLVTSVSVKGSTLRTGICCLLEKFYYKYIYQNKLKVSSDIFNLWLDRSIIWSEIQFCLEFFPSDRMSRKFFVWSDNLWLVNSLKKLSYCSLQPQTKKRRRRRKKNKIKNNSNKNKNADRNTTEIINTQL